MLQELRVAELRYGAVWEVLESAPVTEMARRFGVPRQSVHTWLRRYAADGGLGDHSFKPFGGYSINCYSLTMSTRSDVLRTVMHQTSTTQSGLSRVSGVRQPSISGYLSGSVEISDDQLNRLLSCMGLQLEVVRRPVVPDLTRSERRSWLLHRRLSSLLDRRSLLDWHPMIERNIERLSHGVTGQPHQRNLDKWQRLVDERDIPGLHRVLTGLDRESIEMREVSPLSGLLEDEQRRDALRLVS